MTPRKNEPLSSLTHAIGALLSVAVLVVLVVLAARYSPARTMVGSAIFGSALILLYTASTLFHFFSEGTKTKRVFQRIDHAMIYVLIAGTYTPLALSLPQRAWGWVLFGCVWGFAVLGIVMKSLGKGMHGWLSPLSYLLLGWTAIIAWNPLSLWLGEAGRFWLLAGGIFYSIGSIFYVADGRVKRTRWFGMHELFHLFVMAGSACHVWLVLCHVILKA